MLNILLLLLALLYLDYHLGHPFGVIINGHCYTYKGIITVDYRTPGLVFVSRSVDKIRIIVLSCIFGISDVISLPRTIPPSNYKINYMKDEQIHPCPYELGPPVLLKHGHFHVLKRGPSRAFGASWVPHIKSDKWPIDFNDTSNEK